MTCVFVTNSNATNLLISSTGQTIFNKPFAILYKFTRSCTYNVCFRFSIVELRQHVWKVISSTKCHTPWIFEMNEKGKSNTFELLNFLWWSFASSYFFFFFFFTLIHSNSHWFAQTVRNDRLSSMCKQATLPRVVFAKYILAKSLLTVIACDGISDFFLSIHYACADFYTLKAPSMLRTKRLHKLQRMQKWYSSFVS